jgi:hypothetical protein
MGKPLKLRFFNLTATETRVWLLRLLRSDKLICSDIAIVINNFRWLWKPRCRFFSIPNLGNEKVTKIFMGRNVPFAPILNDPFFKRSEDERCARNSAYKSNLKSLARTITQYYYVSTYQSIADRFWKLCNPISDEHNVQIERKGSTK